MFDAAIAAAAEAAPQKIEPVALVPGLTVHVDGDYLAYYASGNDETTPGEARVNALGIIETFRARVGAGHVVVHSTAPGCHKGERYLAATVKPYQGQRDGGRKPKNHGYLQDFILGFEGSAFRSKTWTQREADDGLAYCSHHALGTQPGYAAIATADKDMRMLPGIHINWRNLAVTRVYPGDYDVIGEDGKQYGLKWFWLQMLMGDTADNCPGLEQYHDGKKLARCGEKTAEKLLAGCTSTEDAAARVIALYTGGYGDAAADRFCEQAALMWMRCDKDASLTDFITHQGHSRLVKEWPPAILAAAERLRERVRIGREKINSLGCGDDPLTADCSAG